MADSRKRKWIDGTYHCDACTGKVMEIVIRTAGQAVANIEYDLK